jgi:hypothetical protein
VDDLCGQPFDVRGKQMREQRIDEYRLCPISVGVRVQDADAVYDNVERAVHDPAAECLGLADIADEGFYDSRRFPREADNVVALYFKVEADRVTRHPVRA